MNAPYVREEDELFTEFQRTMAICVYLVMVAAIAATKSPYVQLILYMCCLLCGVLAAMFGLCWYAEKEIGNSCTRMKARTFLCAVLAIFTAFFIFAKH